MEKENEVLPEEILEEEVLPKKEAEENPKPKMPGIKTKIAVTVVMGLTVLVGAVGAGYILWKLLGVLK